METICSHRAVMYNVSKDGPAAGRQQNKEKPGKRASNGFLYRKDVEMCFISQNSEWLKTDLWDRSVPAAASLGLTTAACMCYQPPLGKIMADSTN